MNKDAGAGAPPQRTPMPDAGAKENCDPLPGEHHASLHRHNWQHDSSDGCCAVLNNLTHTVRRPVCWWTLHPQAQRLCVRQAHQHLPQQRQQQQACLLKP